MGLSLSNLLKIFLLAIVFLGLGAAIGYFVGYDIGYEAAPETAMEENIFGEQPIAQDIYPTINEVMYSCGGVEVPVSFSEDNLATVDFPDGRSFTLEPAVSASGTRYANEGEEVVFWTEGENAFIQENGTVVYSNCVETTPVPTEEPVACTLEAKLCPDGSSVGRVPPSCEFAACPEPR